MWAVSAVGGEAGRHGVVAGRVAECGAGGECGGGGEGECGGDPQPNPAKYCGAHHSNQCECGCSHHPNPSTLNKQPDDNPRPTLHHHQHTTAFVYGDGPPGVRRSATRWRRCDEGAGRSGNRPAPTTFLAELRGQPARSQTPPEHPRRGRRVTRQQPIQTPQTSRHIHAQQLRSKVTTDRVHAFTRLCARLAMPSNVMITTTAMAASASRTRAITG